MKKVRMIMDKLSEYFNYYREYVCTAALYGGEPADLMCGHMILRRYYSDRKKQHPNPRMTEVFLVETLFYETNKVLRTMRGEAFDEPRSLALARLPMLGDPYRIVYNREAWPSAEGNGILLLQQRDIRARGTAMVLRMAADGSLTWLSEQEARDAVRSLNTVLQ